MTDRSDYSITGLAYKRIMETNSKRLIASRTRQGFLGARQRQENEQMFKTKKKNVLHL
jgi:hypothetical protein